MGQTWDTPDIGGIDVGLMTEYKEKTRENEAGSWIRPAECPPAFSSWEEYEANLDDSRPDLSADHDRWVTVLRRARKTDVELFTRLHVLRCGGAKIKKTDDGGYKLVGRYDDTTAWENKDEWKQQVQRLLGPHRDTVARLLREVQKHE